MKKIKLNKLLILFAFLPLLISNSPAPVYYESYIEDYKEFNLLDIETQGDYFYLTIKNYGDYFIDNNSYLLSFNDSLNATYSFYISGIIGPNQTRTIKSNYLYIDDINITTKLVDLSSLDLTSITDLKINTAFNYLEYELSDYYNFEIITSLTTTKIVEFTKVEVEFNEFDSSKLIDNQFLKYLCFTLKTNNESIDIVLNIFDNSYAIYEEEFSGTILNENISIDNVKLYIGESVYSYSDSFSIFGVFIIFIIVIFFVLILGFIALAIIFIILAIKKGLKN